MPVSLVNMHWHPVQHIDNPFGVLFALVPANTAKVAIRQVVRDAKGRTKKAGYQRQCYRSRLVICRGEKDKMVRLQNQHKQHCNS